MSTNSRMLELLERLLAHTEAGAIRWAARPDPSAFEFAGKAGSVVIESLDGDGLEPFRLRLLDKNDRELDYLETDDDEMMQPEPWNTGLRNLYDEARRNALEVDVALNALLAELDELRGDVAQGGG